MKKIMFMIIFQMFLTLSTVNITLAYYIDENGKEVTVTDKNAVNAVDDIEMQEGESLTNHQIVEVVKYVEAKDKDQKTNIDISND